jgi:hypothetical protein
MPTRVKHILDVPLLGKLAPGQVHNHYIRLERFERYKRSSLIWKLVNYSRKKFYNIHA